VEIEMRSMRQPFLEENMEIFEKFPDGGDKLLWIHTSTTVADCLTKRMKPDLEGSPYEPIYCVELTRKDEEIGGIRLISCSHSFTPVK